MLFYDQQGISLCYFLISSCLIMLNIFEGMNEMPDKLSVHFLRKYHPVRWPSGNGESVIKGSSG